MSEQVPIPVCSPQEIERLKIALEAWKHVVSVQMHFNDIEMKIRALYFTILAAAIGAIGVVQGKTIEMPYLDLQVSLAMLVLFAVIPLSSLFYFVDRHWYHRLLQAAVVQGGLIEKMYAEALPEIQLGRAITAASPLKFPGWIWRSAFFFIREDNFRKHTRLHSDAKIEILYKPVMLGIGFCTSFYALFKGLMFSGHPPMYWIVEACKAVGHNLSRFF